MEEDKKQVRARGHPADLAEGAFPYHYGLEADSYTFYRVPKLLFSEHEFSGLSTDAKMLYGLLLDRMQLSAKNGWVDEHGRIYIYFKIESVMKALSCGNKKACALLAELDEKKGIGLISRVKQGMGRPDRIYVHKCITREMSGRHIMKCQNDISCGVESTSQDMSEPHCNNTEKNKTNNNDTESILSHRSITYEAESAYRGSGSSGSDTMDRYDYKRYFEDVLEIDSLMDNYPLRRDVLNEILELIVDTCSTRQEYIRIAGDDKPTPVVRETFMKLNDSHIRYVLECMDGNHIRIRNIRQYLLAALYNSTMTISNYYDAEVRTDMYLGGRR